MAHSDFSATSTPAWHLSRRGFVAGLGATALAGIAAPAQASPATGPVVFDRARRTMRFERIVQRAAIARALRSESIPHRWLAPDSLELHGWIVETPQRARGFGWTSLDEQGRVAESWAELVVQSFDDRPSREFEIAVGDEVLETVDRRVLARVDSYPPICLRDLAGRLRPRDHVNLLAHDGPVARPHRLVAVA